MIQIPTNAFVILLCAAFFIATGIRELVTMRSRGTASLGAYFIGAIGGLALFIYSLSQWSFK